MSEAEIIGLVVIGLTAIVGLFGTITVPIIKLNNNITTLNDRIDHMRENDDVRDQRIRLHGEKLDEHEKILARHTVQIEHIEKDITREA